MREDDWPYDTSRAGVAVTLALAVVGLTACTAVTNPHHRDEPEDGPEGGDETGMIDPSGAPDTPMLPERLHIFGTELA